MTGATPTSGNAIECRGLRKVYRTRRYQVVAVDAIDLTLPRGECLGLLGPNGAGKTTTVEILEGLLEPTAGEVRVLGLDWQHDEHTLREKIGVALQETQLADKLSVVETLDLFRSFYHRGPSTQELLAAVELEEKKDAWVSKLSGGQRQRLAMACALVGDPEILFLDEPTTGLDPQSRRHVWDLVLAYRARGGTVLLTTHYMEEAERLASQVAIVDHGRVIREGTPRALIASLGGEHVIEFELSDGVDLSDADQAALRALPSVEALRREAGAWALAVRASHEAVPGLLRHLDGAGKKLARLGTRQATLEDVFVAATGRHLRDG